MFEVETCSTSSDTGYDLFVRAQCRVGPSSLKGNGNSFTQYERAGEACSSGCTNPVSYTVFMSGVCASVTGLSGSAKTTRCRVNSDDTFTLTESAYSDDSCSTLLISNELPDQDVVCTDPVQLNVTTADDEFGQNGFIYSTWTVSQASCNSEAPSQCGSAVYLSGAAGILTALLAASAASIALHFA
jgi:hypothetical protein